MKKFSFLALAAVGLLLGACSSDKDEVPVLQNDEDFKDGAYIGLSLQLPSADNTTRANDDLSNGTEDEFAVKNATLYIFKLAKSSTDNPDEAATYVDKVSLGTTYDPDEQGGINPDKWGVQTGVDATNITSTYNQATLIPNALASQMKADLTNNYYAYVIINHNGQITDVTNNTTFATFSNQQFTQIGADIAAEKNIYESGLLMTNAPICDKPGGSDAPATGAKYTTLVKLDNSKIFGGKAEAEANPAGCVYVERAAVKITVEDGRGDNTKIGNYNVAIIGWQVINNEPKYYNTRHIDAAWGPYFNEFVTTLNSSRKYRFVSKNQFEPTLPSDENHTVGFRTYFAQDPQYDDNATLDNTVASETRPWIPVGVQKHAYTTENTFDVAHQTWRNTTMVTLKVQIGDDTNDFYTVGKNGQTMYPETDALAAIVNLIKSDNDVTSAMDNLRKKISENNTNKPVTSGLKVTITTAPSTGTTGVAYTVGLDYKLDGAAYSSFGGTDEATLKSTLETKISTYLSNNADAVLLSYYKGGISYYNVRIQHFGEFETPWSATGAYISGGGKDVNEIYGIGQDPDKSTERFLGRYGVVRDNWYKLSIDKIGKIGSAEPVDPSTTTPDTPDDEIENFISVHVHIVPWVLRSQSVQF